jgi:hypothetical protein
VRSEQENEKIDQLARAVLQKRGVRAEDANYEQASEAYSVAAEAVARGKTTLAETLAVGAVHDDAGKPDELTLGVLSRFATDGKFVADLSVTEEEFLRAAVKAEQERTQAVGVPSRAPVARSRSDLIAADRYSGDNCPDCMKDWLDCTC